VGIFASEHPEFWGVLNLALNIALMCLHLAV